MINNPTLNHISFHVPMGAHRIFSRSGQIHSRSQDILWGVVLFSSKKVDDLFVVALKS